MKKVILVIGLIVSLALMGTSLFFIFIYEKPILKKQPKSVVVDQTLSYLMVDINPSVELGINDGGVIQEVNLLNEEAVIAYSDENIVGKTLEAGTTEIVNTAIEMGYINELGGANAVTLTPVEENDETTSLVNKAEETLNVHFTRKGLAVLVVTAGLNDEIKAKAEEYNIGYGKMLLITRAVQLDPTLVEADLVSLSVKNIQAKIKLKVKDLIASKKAEQLKLKNGIIASAKLTLKSKKDILLAEAEKQKGSPLTEEEKNQVLKENLERLRADVEAAKLEIQKARLEKKEISQKTRERYINKSDQNNLNTQTRNNP